MTQLGPIEKETMWETTVQIEKMAATIASGICQASSWDHLEKKETITRVAEISVQIAGAICKRVTGKFAKMIEVLEAKS